MLLFYHSKKNSESKKKLKLGDRPEYDRIEKHKNLAV